MKTKHSLSLIKLPAFTLIAYFLSLSFLKVTPVQAQSTPSFPPPTKEIGTFNGSGTFTPKSEFIVGQEAIVKLTMYGANNSTSTPIPQDIMLVMDKSGSMMWRWYGYSDYDPSHPQKIQVAKQALNTFIDSADPNQHNVGLASYRGLIHGVLDSDDTSEENVNNGVVETQTDTNLTTVSGHNQVVGIRFVEVSIPQGSTINNAYLNFVASETTSGPTNLVFYGEDVDNSALFAPYSNNNSVPPYAISSRTKTSASLSWNSIQAWTDGQVYQSPNMKTIVQEIVSRSGWSSNNALTFIVTGSGDRVAGTRGVRLHVDYTAPGGGARTYDSLYKAAMLDHALSNNYTSVKNKVTALTPGGTTSIGAGLAVGLVNLLKDTRPGAEKVIILATDGQQSADPAVFDTFSDSEYNGRTDDTMPSSLSGIFATRSILQAAKNAGVKVHTVGIGGDVIGSSDMVGQPWTCPLGNTIVDTGEEYLECVAHYTGGEYFFAPTPEDLISIYANLGQAQLNWNISFQDLLVDVHFDNLGIVKVTDLNNNTLSHSLTVTNNRIAGSFGVVGPGQGRVVYIRTTVAAGASGGTSWTTPVDALPDSNNKVTYTNPDDNTEISELFFATNPTITVRYPRAATISGRVYIDANYSCSLTSGEAGTNKASLNLQQVLPVSPTCPAYSQTLTPNADGTFTFNNLSCFQVATSGTTSATYRLTVNSTDPAYTSRCGNVFNISLTENQNYTINPELSPLRDPWFQVHNGGIYALGNISSSIPNTATPPQLVTSDSAATNDIVVGSSISTGQGSVSSTNWTATPSQISPVVPKFAKLKADLTPYFDESTYDGHAPNPTHASSTSGNVGIYYSGADVTLNGNWQNISQPFIIMAEGSITIPDSISSSIISLSNSGFLMLMAKKDIIISSNIGTNTNSDKTPQLEGLFVAGRNFNVGGSDNYLVDKRINIKGTAAYGTEEAGQFISGRSHEENQYYPSDYFIYNPKLVVNTPAILAEPLYSWEEVK